MPEQYIYDSQPDYDNFPEGEFYARKRQMLHDIESEYSTTGTLSRESLDYLIHKSTNFWQLFDFTADLRIDKDAEIFLKDLEIADLKRRLEGGGT